MNNDIKTAADRIVGNRNFLIWFCFMFIVILYAAFGCHDIGQPDVIRNYDTAFDTMQYRGFPNGLIRPNGDTVYKDGSEG